MVRNDIRYIAVVALFAVLLTSCGIKRKKYDNPITKDTQQPDKVLFDKAVNDIEHSRFEVARLLLQNLINTYDTSEYLAKAKLAIADAWFREGGAHGLAQAEAEYKDFILFYPAMEEAAEAQEKVCDIHYKQMGIADRDPMHALRAEDECKQLISQFPNSKFAPQAQQKLRDIQEVLAEAEYRVAYLYAHKGSNPAAANRYQALTDQFPLYSKADEALWQMAEAYHRMGDKFETQQVAAYTKIVKDYPLSSHAEDAKAQLTAMKRPVPEADPVQLARQKYEIENHSRRGLPTRTLSVFSGKPDLSQAAKAGTPPSEGLRPTIPVSVPQTAQPTLGSNDVTISQPGANSAIDKGEEVRSPVAAGGAAAGGAAAPATPPAEGAAAPAAAKPAAATPPGTTPGTPAATTPGTTAPVDAPPQNHTGTPKQQLKAQQEMIRKQQHDMKKQQDQQKKVQAKKDQEIKAAAAEAKKNNKKKQDDQKQPQPPQPPPPQPPDGAATGQGAAPPKQ
ncbi:MAG TPA: outer membrane protein assembly factor BamD [Candidatus Acidoferrales bacterium]|jgi:outer membrane protein assembly factor BamD|nr:outer membrane protein assembly factor BamD [Candidatus Acidoferrales bacterium]